MTQDIIVILIITAVVFLLIRHFIKIKCGCGCSDSKSEKSKESSCEGSSCGKGSLKDKK